MAALGSQSIASSYEQLLHVDRDDGGNSTTHVSVKDGDNGTTFGFTIASDALMMSSTNRLEFGDTGTYIHQSADGVLDLVSDTEIEINATTIDINGATDLSGDLTLAGDIVFNAAGKGICLGVTSNTDSNTLDDYEEGTWTPVYEGLGGSIGSTAGAATGIYTKIGRMVIAHGSVVLTNKGSWTGGVRFEGLPFTVGATQANLTNTGNVTLGLTAYDGSNIAPYSIAASTRFYIDVSKISTARTILDAGNVTNTSAFFFNIIYYV